MNEKLSQRLTTEIRREQIIQAALKLIEQQGAERLSIADIAATIDLVPSAIYRHFKSKDQILDAVTDLIRDQLLGIVKQVCQKTPKPLEQLQQVLQLHIKMLKENNGIPRYVFSVQGGGNKGGENQQLYRTVQRYLKEITLIVKAGQAAEQIRKELNAEALALMFLGLLQPAVFLNGLSGGQFDIEQQSLCAWQFFKEAIKTQEAVDEIVS
jgi:AcrR family transcriptional regulator